ncbi:MAG: RNA polymerase sigma factor [Actinobacteria bacterium]|nr:RNA polymerase sigma factor [Actinomycetota bacterium]
MEASPQLNPQGGSGQRTSLPSRLLQTQPDAVLCRLARRGNAGAFEALYGRHHRGVYGFVFHLLGRGATAEDAEDIAQEAFSTAFNRMSEHRPEASFRSWLYTIARNRAYDQIRARKPLSEDVAEFPPVSGTGAEGDAERRAEMAWLVVAMGELPERQREALVMRELGGFSYGEIANGLDTTVPSVKQLINRARGTLASAAEGEELRPPRKLAKPLNALVPALPLAAGGSAASVIGAGGAATVAGAGGFSAVTKIAATVLAAAAVGGGAAGIDHVTNDGKANATRSAASARPDTIGDPTSSATSPVRGDSDASTDPGGSSESGGGRGERRASRGDSRSDGSDGSSDRRSESGGNGSDRSGRKRDSSNGEDTSGDVADQQDRGSDDGVESSSPEAGGDSPSGGDSEDAPESGGDGHGAEPHADGADSGAELPETER